MPRTRSIAANFAAGTALLNVDWDWRLSKLGSRSRTGCWKAQTVLPPTNKPPKHTIPTIKLHGILFMICSHLLLSLVTEEIGF
jgi:hypothetical protein